MAVPGDANVANKEFEKKYKYKDLELEIQKMWKVKTKVIPIVIGALGLVSKDLEKYLLEIPAEVSSKEIQKIALMGTAHILRKTLSNNFFCSRTLLSLLYSLYLEAEEGCSTFFFSTIFSELQKTSLYLCFLFLQIIFPKTPSWGPEKC